MTLSELRKRLENLEAAGHGEAEMIIRTGVTMPLDLRSIEVDAEDGWHFVYLS